MVSLSGTWDVTSVVLSNRANSPSSLKRLQGIDVYVGTWDVTSVVLSNRANSPSSLKRLQG